MVEKSLQGCLAFFKHAWSENNRLAPILYMSPTKPCKFNKHVRHNQDEFIKSWQEGL